LWQGSGQPAVIAAEFLNLILSDTGDEAEPAGF
jgi:hypothetical protein